MTAASGGLVASVTSRHRDTSQTRRRSRRPWKGRLRLRRRRPVLYPSPPPPMNYHYLSARLKSFSTAKSKRTKASSSKQSSSSLKWPHPSTFKATPDSLAEAGFYFNPSVEAPDCATCYMCRKSIEGWEPDDDPFDIHYEKCQDKCAWAVVRCQPAMGEKRYASVLASHSSVSQCML